MPLLPTPNPVPNQVGVTEEEEEEEEDEEEEDEEEGTSDRSDRSESDGRESNLSEGCKGSVEGCAILTWRCGAEGCEAEKCEGLTAPTTALPAPIAFSW